MRNHSEKFLNFFGSDLIETDIRSTEKKYNFLSKRIKGHLLHQIIREGVEILKFDFKASDAYTLKSPFFHNCLILTYIEKGTFYITNENNENVALKKEEVFINYETSKNPLYNLRLLENAENKGMIIIIDEKYLNSFIDDQEIIQCISLLKNKRIFKQKYIKSYPVKLTYIFQFILHYNNHLGQKLFILGKINEIVGGVITVFLRNILNETKEKDSFEKIKDYIDKHYLDPDILSKIQNEFYFNHLELRNEFKIKTGFGIYEYLKNLRLEEAFNLLISKDMRVNEVSEFLGYKSFGYFSKIFKDYFGASPKKVQQKFNLENNR